MPPEPGPPAPPPVPWRTIAAAIGMVLATLVAIAVVRQVSRILVWILIAAFFAVVLTPPVNLLERRLRLRRGLATVVVFFFGFVALAAMLYSFISPIVEQSQHFVDEFPRHVQTAKEGRGPLGGVVKRFDLDRRLEERQGDIRQGLNRLGGQTVDVLRSVGNVLAATVTIVVLTILMLLSGPRMLNGALGALSPPTQEHVRHVALDCAKAVTGYVAGNLLISVIAGAATFLFLTVAGIPFRGVLALWVAFADLIPLVGATLGAIPTVLVGFLHSTPAGIATIVFFVLYQQFENHVLQVTIMSKTVDLNPLVVLISVLIAAELSGIVGALLAIPVAGVIQVVGRDVYDHRRGRLKEEPTIGADQVPVSEVSEDSEEKKEGSAEAEIGEEALVPAVPDGDEAAAGAEGGKGVRWWRRRSSRSKATSSTP